MRNRVPGTCRALLCLVLLWPAATNAEPGGPRRAAGAPHSKASLATVTSPGQWTWAGGSDRIAEVERVGVYGTKGVAAPGNVPGARSGAATWVDASGSFWVFGGRGYARHALLGTLNDLWKWDGSTWTWVSGWDSYGRRGTYGEKGVAAPANEPGARYGAVSWIDASGNLWLFGGWGRDATSSYEGWLSDLWKWDGASWTWMAGPNVLWRPGVYGTLGVAAPENCPGARQDAAAWKDAAGNFWLFGGRGYGAYGSGDLNDLWRWDGTAWTWMGGSSVDDQPGVYGTKGVASPTNYPGGRSYAAAVVGSDGKVRIFGGWGYAATGSGYLNDLWTWDGTSWTWVSGSDGPSQPGVYGTKGVAAPGNVPGARSSASSWVDSTGRFFLLGGGSRSGAPSSDAQTFGDVWMWDGAAWTWVGGASTSDAPGVFGTKGVPAAANVPGARSGARALADVSGGVFLFGGNGASATGDIGGLNDLWRWNGTEWTWLSGTDGTSLVGVYGTKGTASSANHPGARRGAVTWQSANGDTFLFGGHGYSATGLGYLNDLWRWDGSSWTWVSGTNKEDQPAIAGTKGVAAPENMPGARGWGVSWTDSVGNLWLFGGQCPDPYDEGLLNDLWKWDGASWTWMSGNPAEGELGVYGTRGVPAPSNVPGSRTDLTAWTDAAGRLWLFGGYGYSSNDLGDLNDLWRWDGTSWAWMHGSKLTNDSGSVGALGVPAATNVPTARSGAIGSAAPDGTAWVYGGAAFDYWLLNDLWRWDGTNWTWMSGPQAYNAIGVYGVKGISAPANWPGGRAWGASWVDTRGHFWLFGGRPRPGAGSYLNDLWRWDGANWTWMSGADTTNSGGVYGVAGTPSVANTPGARDTAIAWKDVGGRLWLMNGFGLDSTVTGGRLADLWAWEVPGCTPPSAGISAPDSILEGSGPHAAFVADAGAGATYEWTASGGTIDSGQGTPAISFSASAGETNVILGVVVRSGDCATTGEKAIPVGVYYRLEVLRFGAGGDKVLSSGPEYRISCGLDCAAVFAQGSSVTLHSYAGPGSRFLGWQGSGCSGTDGCTVTMDGAKSVSATFVQQAAASFYPVAPCRVADTRNPEGPYGAPALGAGATRAFAVGGSCGVPVDATAVALNVTVAGPTSAGSLTLFPGLTPVPETSVVSFAAGRTRASNVTMPLAGGVLSVLDRQETGSVDLILDVSGYFR